jgi:hypothetical protein
LRRTIEEISSGDLKGKKEFISLIRGTKNQRETYEFFLLATVFNADIGFSTLAEDLEREVLDIRLNLSIVEFATNKTFCIENTR